MKENLIEQQSTALNEFLYGKNVFVNLPTGYGKSLIFKPASCLQKFSGSSAHRLGIQLLEDSLYAGTAE